MCIRDREIFGADILLAEQVEEFDEPELLIGLPPSDGGSIPTSPPPPHDNKIITNGTNRYDLFNLVIL